MATIYHFKAGYTKAGVATAPSVAPTINIVDDDDNLLVNAGVCTASVNMPGLYLYEYTGADNLTVIGLFHTTDTTVDEQDLFSFQPAFDPDTVTVFANALLDCVAGVETGFTLRQSLRLILAALVGRISGAGTTTVHIRSANDAKERITATVDTDGNRVSITEDAT